MFPNQEWGTRAPSVSTDRELPGRHDDGQVRQSIAAADSIHLGGFEDRTARWCPPTAPHVCAPGNTDGPLELLLWLKMQRLLVT